MKTEKDKLYTAVDEFAEAMKVRLIQKQKQGFGGWDDSGIYAHSIPTRLFAKAAQMYAILNYPSLKKELKKKTLVDIANFAMMLWRKL